MLTVLLIYQWYEGTEGTRMHNIGSIIYIYIYIYESYMYVIYSSKVREVKKINKIPTNTIYIIPSSIFNLKVPATVDNKE